MINALQKLIVILFGVSLSIFLSILVMMKGWGLEPKSYFWIIAIGVFGQIVAQIIIAIGGKQDK